MRLGFSETSRDRVWMPLTGGLPEDVAKLFKDYTRLQMLSRIEWFISGSWCQPPSLTILMMLTEQDETEQTLGLTKKKTGSSSTLLFLCTLILALALRRIDWEEQERKWLKMEHTTYSLSPWLQTRSVCKKIWTCMTIVLKLIRPSNKLKESIQTNPYSFCSRSNLQTCYREEKGNSI